MAGCAEPTGVIAGECLTVEAPLTKESAIAAVEGFTDAVERRDQDCANQLVTQWFVDKVRRGEGITRDNWLANGRGGCAGAVGHLHKFPVHQSERGTASAGAKYERQLACYDRLAIEYGEVPESNITGYGVSWVIGDMAKDDGDYIVRFGVIEEADHIKIDYLEIEWRPKVVIPG